MRSSNGHTVFNVGIAFAFLPMAALFARFCEWVVPDRPVIAPTVIQPKYLDEQLLSTVPLALDRARHEIGRFGGLVEKMLDAALPAILSGDERQLRALAEMDSDIDILHGHIVQYLGQISSGKLSNESSAEVIKLLQVTNHLEQIGDIVETNLVRLGRKRIAENVIVSAPTRKVIERYHREVMRALKMAVQAVSEEDRAAALEVKHMKKSMAKLAESMAQHGVDRLLVNEPNRLQTFTREMEIIENLSRIYRLCRKIAHTRWIEPAAPEAEMHQAAE